MFTIGDIPPGNMLTEDFQLRTPEYFSQLDGTEAEKAGKIALLAGQCSDYELCTRFSKTKNAATFIKTLDEALFKDHIRPFLDRQIHKALVLARETEIPLYFRPDRGEGQHLIPLQYIEQQALPEFSFLKKPDGMEYRLNLLLEDKPLSLLQTETRILSFNPCMILNKNRIIPLPPGFDGQKLKPFQTKLLIQVPETAIKRYLETFVMKNIRTGTVQAEGFTIRDTPVFPEPELSPEYDWQGNAVFILWFRYGDKRVMAGNTLKAFVNLNLRNDTYEFTRIRRNTEAEQALIRVLTDAGLRLKNENTLVRKDVSPEGLSGFYALIAWVNSHHELIKKHAIHVLQPEKDKSLFYGPVELRTDLRKTADWFELYGVVQFGDFEIPFIQLKDNLLHKQPAFVLPDGTIAIIPDEWFTRYADLFRLGVVKQQELVVKKHHYMLVSQVFPEEVFPEISTTNTTGNAGSREVPSTLKTKLRGYQQEGLNWMHVLRDHGFGGCLADDMGLGKTIQTLALLLTKPVDYLQASLLVMPSSLIHNWIGEIRRFAPSLRYLVHTGPDRHSGSGLFNAFDLVLTTYGTLRNDIDWLKHYRFYYAILDESQFIKNPAALTTEAACALQADHRLVLTGTPVENSLTDLWSQMNFLNPGLLGSLSFFQKEIASVDAGSALGDKGLHLKKLISPFILRRLKQEVAPELPELTRQIIWCEMDPMQRKAYEQEKSAARNVLLESIENQSFRQDQIRILAALIRLRQLANHPALTLENYSGESGKMQDVRMQMETLIDGKHKVLIFSSFVQHLKLYEAECIRRNWKYSMLTGATRDRESAVARFRESDTPVFLISLKAGGFGLNLSEADYVFMLDPWWNPAAEQQAVDRAHRIGQNKPVFAYNFISKDTVEEKIMALQEKKKQIAGAFVQTGNPLKDLTDEESLWLFS